MAPTLPLLRPIWTERNDLLRNEDGRLRAELTLARLEADAGRAHVARAASGAPWPDPTGLWAGATGPFTWQHPDAFVHLAGVQALGAEMFQLLHDVLYVPHAQAVFETGFQMAQFYQSAMFAHHGRLVYYLDDRMVELLLATPRPRMPAGALHFPRHAFAIALPPGRFTVKHSSDPVPQEADGLFVAVNQPDGDDGGARTVSILLTGRSGAGEPANDTVYSAGAVLPAEAWVHELKFKDATPIVGDMAEAVWRLVVGLTLYLQSDHPRMDTVAAPARRDLTAIRNPAKRRKAELAERRLSRLGYVVIGSGEGADLGAVAFTQARAAGQWRLTEHIWVAGHWREVAYGPRHERRRRQWIRPYVKGADYAMKAGLTRRVVRGPAGVDAPAETASD